MIIWYYLIGGFVITLDDDANGLHIFGLKPPTRSLGFLQKWRLDIDDFLLGKHCWTVWWDDLGRLGWGSRQLIAPSAGSLNMKCRQLTDWWFGTMDFYDFPFSWEWNNHPNWLSHIFQRGRSTTNQFFEWGQALEFLAMAGLSKINREMNSKQPNPMCWTPVDLIWRKGWALNIISSCQSSPEKKTYSFWIGGHQPRSQQENRSAWVRSRHKSPAWGCRNARTSDITCQGKTTIAAKRQVMSDVILFFNKGGSNPL